jgi:hypothetical protein
LPLRPNAVKPQYIRFLSHNQKEIKHEMFYRLSNPICRKNNHLTYFQWPLCGTSTFWQVMSSNRGICLQFFSFILRFLFSIKKGPTYLSCFKFVLSIKHKTPNLGSRQLGVLLGVYKRQIRPALVVVEYV